MWLVMPWVVAFFVIGMTFAIYKWKQSPKRPCKLPPGSMGLPFVGETFQFFTQVPSSDVPSFIKERTERYGPIFKTSVAGKPIIVSTDLEFNNFIFQQEGRSFQLCYPESFKEILGKQGIGEMHGVVFKYLKSLIMNLLGPESLKQSLLPQVSQAVSLSLSSWLKLPSVELKEATAKMIFDWIAKKLITYEPSDANEDLKKYFDDFMYGLFSFPFYLPGTAFYRCLQGRKKAMKILKNLLEARQAQPREEEQDFLDVVVKELDKEGSIMTPAIALDLLFVVLFASFETTSIAMTFCMKLLSDHPQVLEKLTIEQDGLIKARNVEMSEISWEEYKSMTFTSQVIKESLRLADIAPTVFRRSLEDVNVQGYTIPKDWTIAVCTLSVHRNPDLFPDPFSFKPSRWEGMDLSAGGKNFMAFGGGSRLCIGADFSKVVMTVFLHHLVTNYRWKAIKGGETIRRPGLAFPNGFHIQLFNKT